MIERGRELHRKYHGTEPPHVMLTEFCVCGTNLAETEEEARQYQGKFVESNFYHYEFLGEHFKTVKGYDSYQQKAEIARKAGLEGAVNGFMQAASWGTPDKILRGLETAPEGRRRFRAERRLPLRRHALRGRRARPEAVRQGGAAGAQIARVRGSGPGGGGVSGAACRAISTGRDICWAIKPPSMTS